MSKVPSNDMSTACSRRCRSRPQRTQPRSAPGNPVVLDHALDPADLALDAAEPAEELVLGRGVSPDGRGARRFARRPVLIGAGHVSSSGVRRTRRSSWALSATTMVDADMSTSPIAGLRVIPAQANSWPSRRRTGRSAPPGVGTRSRAAPARRLVPWPHRPGRADRGRARRRRRRRTRCVPRSRPHCGERPAVESDRRPFGRGRPRAGLRPNGS
jgi:hypothetical protein